MHRWIVGSTFAFERLARSLGQQQLEYGNQPQRQPEQRGERSRR